MISQFLKKNGALKIGAVLLAIFLWLFVINDGYRIDFLEQPVSIKVSNVESSLALVEKPGNIEVKVRAPLSVWTSIDTDSIIASVNLEGFEAGEHTANVKVTTDSADIQVIDYTPKKTSIILDEIITQKKEINPQITGTANEGYTVNETELLTTEVTITGAGKAIENIREVVAPVNVDGIMSELTKTTELKAIGINGEVVENVSLEPKNIEVKIQASRESKIKTVGIKTITEGKVASGYWLAGLGTNPSVVAIKGKEELLGDINFIESAPVSIEGLQQSKSVPISLNLPEGIEIEGDSNIVAELSIEKIFEQRDIDITPKIINGNGAKVTINPPRARLNIEGIKDDVRAVTDQDIQILIDLQGRGKGTFNLPVNQEIVTLPQGITLKEAKTKQFTITIE